MNPISTAVNVFNKPLIVCGTNPMTGVYRDGCCNTGSNDRGTHTVCAVVTNVFLQYSKSKGNDLTMDYPPTGFKGLVEGDKWCLCVSRWIEAYEANVAPPVILEATHIKTLDYISLEELMKYRYVNTRDNDWTEINNKLVKTPLWKRIVTGALSLIFVFNSLSGPIVTAFKNDNNFNKITAQTQQAQNKLDKSNTANLNEYCLGMEI